MFCPASVTKLYSTAAAMTDLGADHRFQTPVVRRGEVDAEGTLQRRPDPGRAGRPLPRRADRPRGDVALRGQRPHLRRGQLQRHARAERPARRARPPGARDQGRRDQRRQGRRPGGRPPLRAGRGQRQRAVAARADRGQRQRDRRRRDPRRRRSGEPATVRIVPETDFVTMEAEVETVEADAVAPARSPRRRAASVRGPGRCRSATGRS